MANDSGPSTTVNFNNDQVVVLDELETSSLTSSIELKVNLKFFINN